MDRKTIIILAIPVIILTAAPLTLPETPEEIKAIGVRALQLLPSFLKEVWRGLLEFLQTMWNRAKTFFNPYLSPFLQNIWQERKEIVSQELEKEKTGLFEEIKTILSKFPKSLWEKIKALIK